MRTTFYWVLAVLPSLPYPSLCYAYRRILVQKYIEIQRLMTDKTFGLYVTAYGFAGHDSGDTVQKLFDLYYHWRAYFLPVLVAVLLITASGAFSLIWAGISMELPVELESLAKKAPPSVIASIAGAYLWGLYDVLRRYWSIDLSPISLHFIWLRLLIAPVLGSLADATFKAPTDLLAAFALGAFPTKTLLNFVREQAKKRFNISAAPLQAEEPNLHKIQGQTADVIDRLSEEGFHSSEHIANADPIRMLLRTNFGWKQILDTIDQSMLFNYIGEKIEQLRPIGIRGVIEMVEVGKGLVSDDPDVKRQAELTLALIVSKLGEEEHGVRNLIQTLVADPQVGFIFNLWGEAVGI